MPILSVIIPCYHSSPGFPERVRQLSTTLEKDFPTGETEIILVADGLETASNPYFQAAVRISETIRQVTHFSNYGEQRALITGILSSAGDVVATMDDDGQHDEAVIFKLCQPVLSGNASLVYGVPSNSPHGYARGFLSKAVKNVVSKLSGFPVGTVSSFRAFRGELRQAFRGVRTRDVIIDSLLLDHAERLKTIPVPYRRREEGESGYPIRALLRHAVNIFFSFPSRPLRAIGLWGTFGLIFGALVLTVTLVESLFFGHQPEGYATLIGVVTVLSGIQLLGISVTAEYLGRLYEAHLQSHSIVVSSPLNEPLQIEEIE